MKTTPSTLPDALLQAAKESARWAFEHRDSVSFQSRLSIAIHAGAALEYLLKFLLASESPLLVAEVRPSNVKVAIKTRIGLSRSSYGSDLADIRSCSIEDAFLLVDEVLGMRILRLSEFRAVSAARNAALHLAVVPDASEQQDNLCAIILAFEYASRSDSAIAFSGSTQTEMLTFRESRMQDRYEAAKAKTEPPEAPDSHRQTSAHGLQSFLELQATFLDTQAEIVFGPDPRLRDGVAPFTRPFFCARCGLQGIALCWVEGIGLDDYRRGRLHDGHQIQIDAKAGGESEGVGLWGVAFACGWCGLTLKLDDLVALKSKKDPWSESLMNALPLSTEDYVNEEEPYELKILR